jgi:hypothetical protein
MQQTTLEHRHTALQAQVGPVDQIRAERDALDRRLSQLEHDHHALVDRAARTEIARAPAWLMRDLGERPDGRRRSRAWDRAALLLARYRVTHELADDVHGLGPEPANDHARAEWRHATSQLHRVARTLRDRDDRDLGLAR